MKQIILLLCISTLLHSEVLKKNYLIYRGTPNEMGVSWQLSTADPVVISWGFDELTTIDSETVLPGDDNLYSYVIEGLEVNTKYFYSIEGVGKGSFITTPKEDTTHITLFAYGDSRSTPRHHNRVCQQMINRYQDNSKQTIAIHSGDLLNDGDAEYDWTTEVFPTNYPALNQFFAEVPLVVARGNHEESGDLFRKYFPYEHVKDFYWEFTYGPCHIFVIDQYVNYKPGSEQYNWLVSELSNSVKAWKIVAFHSPGWAAGGHKNNRYVQDYLQPLFIEYGVDIIITGHNHYYSRCEVDGIQHITTGGGGAVLYDPDLSSDKVVTGDKSFHFLEINIKNEICSVEVARDDGSIIETFTLISADVPFCKLTSPSRDTLIESGTGVLLTADAITYGKRCDSISFFIDDEYIANDDEFPYEGNWIAPATALDTFSTYAVMYYENGIDTSDITSFYISDYSEDFVISRRVISGIDDAEEKIHNGDVSTNSSDLELVEDGADKQIVGLRFQDITIPQGFKITNATVTFTVDEENDSAPSLSIYSELSDNASPFERDDFNLSQREKTNTFVSWSPETIDKIDTEIKTPDISFLIQSVIDIEDWQSGNALAILIEGDGTATVSSYEDNTNFAAQLDISYTKSGTSINHSSTGKNLQISRPHVIIRDGLCSISNVESVEIYSVSGRLLHKKEAQSIHSIITLKNLSPGFYLLRSQRGTHVTQQKLLIER